MMISFNQEGCIMANRIDPPRVEVYVAKEGGNLRRKENFSCQDCPRKADEDLKGVFMPDGVIDLEQWKRTCGEKGCRVLEDPSDSLEQALVAAYPGKDIEINRKLDSYGCGKTPCLSYRATISENFKKVGIYLDRVFGKGL